VVTKAVRLIEISPNEFSKYFDDPVSVQSGETAKSHANNNNGSDLEEEKTSVSAPP